MPNFPKDTFIKVPSETVDAYQIQIGPNGYTLDKGELAQLMSGMQDDWETLKRNIAVTLVLDGVDINDSVAVIRAIERKPFKAFR